MIATIKDVNSLIDINTVIGKPFTVKDGTTIIPVANVALGFLTGGGEYGKLKWTTKDSPFPFAGGNGAIVSIKPTAFLIDNGKDGVSVARVSNDVATKAFETAEEFIKSFANDEKNE